MLGIFAGGASVAGCSVESHASSIENVVRQRSARLEAFLSKKWSAPCRMTVDTISTVPESRCVIRTITASGNPAPKLGDAAPPASFHLNVAKDRF